MALILLLVCQLLSLVLFLTFNLIKVVHILKTVHFDDNELIYQSVDQVFSQYNLMNQPVSWLISGLDSQLIS